LRLPKSWKKSVKSAVLQVVSLAQLALARARAEAIDDKDSNPFELRTGRLEHEIALLRDEIRIKDQRMRRIAAPRRPHYTAIERLEILELRAMRGWSLRQTASVFLVSPATVASWMKRADEQGPHALLELREPVNKFPEFVHYAVKRLKTLCPMLGKKKIAEILCRAGLHLGATTVGRMLKEKPSSSNDDAETVPDANEQQDMSQPSDSSAVSQSNSKPLVTAKHPNHVWHVDLTVVPTLAGMWCAWFPFALPQCWPFCWWTALVVDHYSRRVMGFTVFKKQPMSEDVPAFLGRTISKADAKPKYLISDKGVQFWCKGYKRWCKRRKIKPRFGAVGQYGSIAVIERFIRTLKESCTRRIVVPLQREPLRRELRLFTDWFNESRPHSSLQGKTPNELYHGKRPTNRNPRIEP